MTIASNNRMTDDRQSNKIPVQQQTPERHIQTNKTQPSKMDFKISPKYKASKWLSLNLTQKDSADWQIAVDIFEDRIKGRFLKQVEVLESNSDRQIKYFSGFAIMAIDCLLIETLQQFYKGTKRTGKAQDEVMFHEFFQRTLDLSSFFDTAAKTNVFYVQIRCGILHQAQTKKKSTIHIRSGTPIAQWVDIADHSQGLSINRHKFHKALVGVYEKYVADLRSNNNLNLRRKFERKMNMIANQT